MNRDLAATGTWSALRVRRGGDRGAALVELAVALPLIVLLLIGTIDFARVFYYAIELTNAARAATQYAASLSIRPDDAAGIRAAAQSAAPNISPVIVTLDPVTPSRCWCATDDGMTFSGPVVCPVSCISPQHLMQTIKVDVSITFRLISPFPGIPNNLTLHRSATTRVPI
jgi:Flp pilus assembly protein TadG